MIECIGKVTVADTERKCERNKTLSWCVGSLSCAVLSCLLVIESLGILSVLCCFILPSLVLSCMIYVCVVFSCHVAVIEKIEMK